MTKIVFNKPDADSPGFLLRAKKALEFQEKINKGIEPSTIDEMVEFVLPYISEPVDRDEARNAIYEASESQFLELMSTISGGDANPTPAERKETS